MAENENPDGGNDKGGKDYTPPATQADLDAIIKDRVARERAKYADYPTLKEKAGQLDQIQQASQTEAEKTAQRIAQLEEQLTQTQTSALRSRIQAKHGISDEDAALFLTATDEDTLTAQAARLAERAADERKRADEERKKTGGRDAFAGRTPTDSAGPDAAKRDWLRSITDRD